MEEKNYVDFEILSGTYKTLLTKKYQARKTWAAPVQGEVRSHLPGTVLSVSCKAGDTVKAGDLLLIHEAMKMQNRILAPISGVITELNVTEGERVAKGHLMVKIEKA